MRALASLTVALTLAANTPAAFAGKCYVDSDCPTGMVCNSGGGCEVPAGSTGGGGGGGGGGASTTKVIIYGVVLAVVIIAILVPAMRPTDEASQPRPRLAEAFTATSPPDPPATCGLVIPF